MDQGNRTPSDHRAVSGPKVPFQTVPFLVLAGVMLVMGLLFFQVVRPLLLPLFMAAVVALLLFPLQKYLVQRLGNRSYLAAGLLTALVIIAALAPVALGLNIALRDLDSRVASLKTMWSDGSGRVHAWLAPDNNSWVASLESWSGATLIEWEQKLVDQLKTAGNEFAGKSLKLIDDIARMVLGTLLFIVALFFFLAEGESIVAGWEELTPMKPEHDRVIREEFSLVCRSVVWATFIAALVQGIVFGIGASLIDAFAGTGLRSGVILLSVVTVVFALVPILGAAAVWIPLSLYWMSQGQWTAGIVLAIYGASIVSTIDNVIKIFVIQDSAKLHPLLVMVCVFGGLQLLGIFGIFVGPVVGAVVFALMRILKREVLELRDRHLDEVRRGTPSIQTSQPSHGPRGKSLSRRRRSGLRRFPLR